MATEDFHTSAAKAFREHYDKLVDSIQERGVKSAHYLEVLLCFYNENSLLCRMLAPGRLGYD